MSVAADRQTRPAPTRPVRVLATDGQVIIDADGRTTDTYPRLVVPAALAAWPDTDLIIWTLTPPETLGEWPADLVTPRGWRRLKPVQGRTVHLAPTARTPFAGLALPDLILAQAVYADIVGAPCRYSGTTSLQRLLPDLPAAGPEPGTPGPNESAWPATNTFWVDPDARHRLARGGWVRCYDRIGGFLSAWGGQPYTDGDWVEQGPQTVVAGGPKLPAGYWSVDTARLTRPWLYARHGQRSPGRCWITTPLLERAVELDESVDVLVSYTTTSRRHLDRAAEKLRDGFLRLDPADPVDRAVRATLKNDGYAKLTNLFGHPDRLPAGWRRPWWRRAIWDRFVANTDRSLDKATNAPLAWCRVDTALFVVDDPDRHPAGLPLENRLGSWKPTGTPVPAAYAAELLERGPGAIVDEAHP